MCGGSRSGGCGYPHPHPHPHPDQEGEGSVFQRELGGGGAKDVCAVVKRKLSIAGRDYAHETTCLACFAGSGSGGKAAAGGELFLRCRLCPMALHSGCARHLGCQEVHGQVGGVTFTCPHHACGECGRKAPAAGGMLFRCEALALALALAPSPSS